MEKGSSEYVLEAKNRGIKRIEDFGNVSFGTIMSGPTMVHHIEAS
jgi:hypothetical protein